MRDQIMEGKLQSDEQFSKVGSMDCSEYELQIDNGRRSIDPLEGCSA